MPAIVGEGLGFGVAVTANLGEGPGFEVTVAPNVGEGPGFEVAVASIVGEGPGFGVTVAANVGEGPGSGIGVWVGPALPQAIPTAARMARRNLDMSSLVTIPTFLATEFPTRSAEGPFLTESAAAYPNAYALGHPVVQGPCASCRPGE